MGDIIMGCWQGRFKNADDVLNGVLLIDCPNIRYRRRSVIASCGRAYTSAPRILEMSVVLSVLGLLVFLAHRSVGR